MKKLNQSGIAHLAAISLVVLVLAIGGVGWYVWQSNNKTKPATSKTSQTAQTSQEEPKLSNYKNDELAIAFNYSSDWGKATLVDGPLISPQTGKYKQLTFSNQPSISINFVLDAYQSPLDGCGKNTELENAQHRFYSKQASVIGWSGNDIERYMTGQGFNGPTIYKENMVAGDTGPGWTKVEIKDDVLTYKDIDNENTRLKAGNENGCFSVTQAQADEANAFLKFFHYAVNFSNSKVKGINAQFDARKTDDSIVRTQLVDSLNTFK